MNRIDWRVVIGLVVGASLFAQWSMLGASLMLGGAAYLVLQAGLSGWRGGPLPRRHTKETYWRGRRIDLETPASRTSVVPGPSLQTVLYLALGTGLAVIAAGMLLGVAVRS
jgi:hypothetical protein